MSALGLEVDKVLMANTVKTIDRYALSFREVYDNAKKNGEKPEKDALERLRKNSKRELSKLYKSMLGFDKADDVSKSIIDELLSPTLDIIVR